MNSLPDREARHEIFTVAKKEQGAFSFLAMSLPRGSTRPRRNARLSDDHAHRAGADAAQQDVRHLREKTK